MAAIGCIAFVGCSKDDDEDNSNHLLEGTSWEYRDFITLLSGHLEAVAFRANSECSYTVADVKNGNLNNQTIYRGTYNYAPPTVTCDVSYNGAKITKTFTVYEGYILDEQTKYKFTKSSKD